MKRSKTPSYLSVLHESVFFIDRNLGKTFPTALSSADLNVQAHDDHFPGHEPTPDERWLTLISEKEWIGVTHDGRMRHTSRLRDHAMEKRCRVFIIKGAAKSNVLAANFVKTSHLVGRFLHRNSDPFLAKVYRHPDDPEKPGRVEMWLSYSDWLRQRRAILTGPD